MASRVSIVLALLLAVVAGQGCSDGYDAKLAEAQALAAEERHDEALVAYDEAIELGSPADDQPIHYDRAVTLIALGRYDEALSSLDRLVRASPDDAEAAATKQELLRVMNACGE